MWSWFKKNILRIKEKESTPIPPVVVVPPVQPIPEIPTPEEVENFPHRDPSKQIMGVDIYWGDIVKDWALLATHADFIIIKASEGDYRDDPKLHEYRAQAMKHGIPCGFYHFFRSNKDAVEQAKDFIRNVGAIKPGELMLMCCDFETEDDPKDGFDILEVEVFNKYLENYYGFIPFIYGGRLLKENVVPDRFKRYPLWLSHYTKIGNEKTPKPWNRPLILQYTETAKLSGMGNKDGTDHNIFYGSWADFQALIKR